MKQNDTLQWYQNNAEEFISNTRDVDMEALYDPFLNLIPSGGYIMDLGCGAGSAALYFTQKGYQVLAVDGCREMCYYTKQRVGCQVRELCFDELDYVDMFDGIWACASLLHVRKAELPDVFYLIHRALKKNGVFYASFKYGETEREESGRFFSDFTAKSLQALLNEAGSFHVINLWRTNDVRPDRGNEQWVNVLCIRET